MRFHSLVVLLLFVSPLSAQTVALVEKPEEYRWIVGENPALEKIATGFRFLEGPAWNRQTRVLTFSDIPGDRLYRFDPATEHAAPQVFREPSNHANGNTFDSTGNLFTCEHGTRRVTCTHPDGSTRAFTPVRSPPGFA